MNVKKLLKVFKFKYPLLPCNQIPKGHFAPQIWLKLSICTSFFYFIKSPPHSFITCQSAPHSSTMTFSVQFFITYLSCGKLNCHVRMTLP